MQGAPVLVVGGAGYIGSHTTKLLAEDGFAPVVYDNFSRGSRELARWGRVVEGDLADRARLASVIADVRPVGCIHFAPRAHRRRGARRRLLAVRHRARAGRVVCTHQRSCGANARRPR